MSGTVAGGLKAAATNKAKHGADFYRKIGAEGGANGHTGGFYQNRELACTAGALGGKKSRRSWTPEQREEAGANLHRAKTTWFQRMFGQRVSG
jgi:uncharacterized protein